MTRLFLALTALAVTVSAPVGAADRRYSVTDFDRVQIEGPYVVRLTTGSASSAVASGPQAGLDRVQIDVSGRTLRVRRNRSYWGGNPGAQEGPLTIRLTTRTLRAARLIGPSSLDVEGLEGLRVDLSVEGSGRLTATEVAADNLFIGLAGSGTIALSGTSETLTADIQGTGDVDAAGLVVDTAAITTTTTGTISATVERAVTVTALGLGTVDILGSPACTVRGPNADLVECGAD